MSTHRAVDLDGDGALDAFVPEPSASDCDNEYPFALYLSRGACGHRVGVIRGTLSRALLASAPRSHGLPDLTTTIERSEQDDPRVPAQRRTTQITYRFDGVAYRERARESRVAVCHHCSRIVCRNTRIQRTSP